MKKSLLKKSLLLLFFTISIAILSSCRSSTPEEDAYQSFNASQYSEAMQKLNEGKKTISAVRYHLDKAYIERARNHFDISQTELQLAAKRNQSSHCFDALLDWEIRLNQMFNAYLLGDVDLLHRLLVKAPPADDQIADWLALFQGIDSAQRADEAAALAAWQKPWPAQPLSSWMATSFDKVLTPAWRQMQITRLFLQRGESAAALGKLEDLQTQFADPQSPHLLLLRAVASLQHASKGSKEQNSQLFNRALNDLNSALALLGKEEELSEKQQAIDLVVQEITRSFYWNDRKEVDQIQKTLDTVPYVAQNPLFIKALVAQVPKYLSQGDLAGTEMLTFMLNTLLKEDSERAELTQLLLEEAQSRLLDEKISEARSLVELINQLAVNSQPTTQIKKTKPISQTKQLLLAQQTITLLKGELNKNKPNMNQAEELAALFLLLEQEDSRRQQAALELLPILRPFWSKPSKRANLYRALKLAGKIAPPNRLGSFKMKVLDLLKNNYAIALAEDDFNALLTLLPIANSFHLPLDFFSTPEEQKTLLQDGQQLYKSRQWHRSYAIAQWLLQIDPQNNQAKMLAALSAYGLGNYKIALPLLRQTRQLNQDLFIAYLISELAEGKKDMANAAYNELKKIELSQEQKIRIAFIFLKEGDYKETKKWLDQLPENGLDRNVAFMLFALKEGEDEKVIKTYLRLPIHLQQEPTLIAMTLLAAVELNDRAAAAELASRLENYYASNGSNNNDLPYPLLLLTEEKELIPSPHYALFVYFKQLKDEEEKALFYLKKIEAPPLEPLLGFAEKLAQSGKERLAIQLVSPYLIKTKQLPPDLEKQLLISLAQWHDQLSEWPEASSYWQKAIEKQPCSEWLFRLGIALMHQQRYNEALEPLLQAHKQENKVEYTLAVIETMTHLRHLNSAIALASDLIDQQNLNDSQKLQLALLIDHPSTTSITDRLFDQISFTPSKDFAKPWINFYLTSGREDKAIELIDALCKQKEFARRQAAACYALVAEKAKDKRLQSQYALNAIRTEPDNYYYGLLYLEKEKNQDFFKKNIKTLQPLYSKHLLGPSRLHLLALSHIEQAIDDVLEGTHEMASQSPSLKQALHISRELIAKQPFNPIYYVTQGQALFLNFDEEAAFKAYEKAYKLDPSYLLAYKNAATLLQKKAIRQDGFNAILSWRQSIALLQKVVEQSPEDSESWLMLAEADSHLAKENSYAAVKHGLN